jgi:Na+/H+ antiporter NhaA
MKRAGGTWLTIAGLGLILALALVFLYVGWTLPTGEQGSEISTHGYIAMSLGIVATLALGIGLMSLIFYSNRHDRD